MAFTYDSELFSEGGYEKRGSIWKTWPELTQQMETFPET